MRTSRMLVAPVFAAGIFLAACMDSTPRMVVDPELEAIEADYIMTRSSICARATTVL